MGEVKPKKGRIINENTLLVTVDIGKVINTGYYRCPDRTDVKPFEFFNNGCGFNEFWRCIMRVFTLHKLEDVVVGFESTGPYAEPLIHYLRKRGVNLVQVNPMHTKRLKELQGNSPQKTDRKDPKVIADIITLGCALTLVVPQGAFAHLRRLTHARERRIKMQGVLWNQLHALVAVIFPEFLEVTRGSRGKSAQYLLEHYPTSEDIVRFGFERLVVVLKKVSRGRLGEARARALYEAAQRCIGIEEGQESIVFEMRDILWIIEAGERFIEEIEAKMTQYLKEIAYSKYILSMKGIGEITAAGLMGEVGDFRQFKTISEIHKLAGLDLFEISSGQHKGRRRISKRGRWLMRKLLYFAAINVVRRGGILHGRYGDLLKRGMPKMKALIAIARKLLGIIFALVRDRSEYIMDYKRLESDRVEAVASP